MFQKLSLLLIEAIKFNLQYINELFRSVVGYNIFEANLFVS